ncbi:hypothetical protein [Intestinibacter sp.]|uniref:hypothetical protein n=1 Tax=Intestinibacter sp. TaxID=1965304 RepID=UPI003AB84EC7
MKKQLLIGSMLALSTILSACSNDKSNQLYEEAMANGKSSVIEEEYYEAIDDFRSALEYKERDTEAEKLIEQLELLLDAKKAKEDNVYSGEIEKLDKVNSITTDDDVVKEKANEYKNEAEAFTIDEAIVKAEKDLDTPIYDSSKNYEKNHESYISISKEPQYINGEKAYIATVYWYEKGDDFWMHQNVYVFENRIE